MQVNMTVKTNKLLSICSSFLLLVLAVFILTSAVKVGQELVRVFQAPLVEAASEEPTTTPTTPVVIATLPTSPTSTPAPTSDITPTSTPLPAETPMPTPNVTDSYLIAGESGVNVRSGPGLEYDKIDLLAPGADAVILGVNGDWWAIEINGQPGWVNKEVVTSFETGIVPELPAPPLPRPEATPAVEETPVPLWALDENRWIDVDLSEQRLTAYERQTPIKTYLVSTGLPQTPTPVGQYRIWIKLKTDDMAGADYYIKDVPWVMYFHLGYGLHGVTWHANFGHQMSHGCVNQPNDMAEWLFNFADVGTLVNVHE